MTQWTPADCHRTQQARKQVACVYNMQIEQHQFVVACQRATSPCCFFLRLCLAGAFLLCPIEARWYFDTSLHHAGEHSAPVCALDPECVDDIFENECEAVRSMAMRCKHGCQKTGALLGELLAASLLCLSVCLLVCRPLSN